MKRFHWQEYKTEGGQPALSGHIRVRDMPCPLGDFPEKLRTEAFRASRPLQDVLIEIAERQAVQRDLLTGPRLDPRKRHAVAVALRRDQVDLEQLRPYQRRSLTLDLPRIAVVASAGVAEVNGDKQFIGRICKLTLAIAWACETVGAEVYSVLMEGHWPVALDKKQPFRRAQLAYVLCEPGITTPLQSYAVAMNRRNFYGIGFAQAYEDDTEAIRRMSALQGHSSVYWGAAFPGVDGGHGVHWARTQHDADLIIGVGKLRDLKEADVWVEDTRFDVETAVKDIARQAKARYGGRP
jgi:hypothetical protein